MITAPILVFPDWTKPFHVHVDASGITLGVVLTQPGKEILTIPSHIPAESYRQQKRTTPQQKEKV